MTIGAIGQRAREAMLGRGASGRWRVGGLIYVGSCSQLLLHKVEFEDGGDKQNPTVRNDMHSQVL